MPMDTGPDDCVRNHPAWFKADKQGDILIRRQVFPQVLQSGLTSSRSFACVNIHCDLEVGREELNKVHQELNLSLSRGASCFPPCQFP